VNGLHDRAAGRCKTVCAAALSRRFWAPLNFTVRRRALMVRRPSPSAPPSFEREDWRYE
jgi:hypothetical protein